MKKIITNQQKSGVLLMLVICYESRGDKDAKLALFEYFDKIKPYLNNMMDE